MIDLLIDKRLRARTTMQVHVRTKKCFESLRNVSCNCAVAMREGNWILGVYACDPGKPPLAIRYLIDQNVPGATITLVGQKYTVCVQQPGVWRHRRRNRGEGTEFFE